MTNSLKKTETISLTKIVYIGIVLTAWLTLVVLGIFFYTHKGADTPVDTPVGAPKLKPDSDVRLEKAVQEAAKQLQTYGKPGTIKHDGSVEIDGAFVESVVDWPDACQMSEVGPNNNYRLTCVSSTSDPLIGTETRWDYVNGDITKTETNYYYNTTLIP